MLRSTASARPHRTHRRASTLAALALTGLVLTGCGSSGGDGASTTTEAPAATSTEATTTTSEAPPLTTTTGAPTTTTTAAPVDLTPEETAVAFVRAIVEGQSADAYVRDPAVATDAERQLGEMGQAAYDSIALDPVVSQQESGAADECAVNDVTLSCYVLIDRSSSDSEGVNTLVKVGVAINDMTGVMSPEDVGERVPAHVISVEIVGS